MRTFTVETDFRDGSAGKAEGLSEDEALAAFDAAVKEGFKRLVITPSDWGSNEG